MARPRIHDETAMLDAAEALLAEGALTIRALAARTGAPSGTLYHAFGSRDELVARLWLRGATTFLQMQEDALEAHDDPVEATVAAALTLSELGRERPHTAELLMRPRPAGDLPEALAAELDALDGELLGQMKRLARALSGRADRRSVEVVKVCIVDLPSAVRDQRLLAAAVRGVLVYGRDSER